MASSGPGSKLRKPAPSAPSTASLQNVGSNGFQDGPTPGSNGPPGKAHPGSIVGGQTVHDRPDDSMAHHDGSGLPLKTKPSNSKVTFLPGGASADGRPTSVVQPGPGVLADEADGKQSSHRPSLLRRKPSGPLSEKFAQPTVMHDGAGDDIDPDHGKSVLDHGDVIDRHGRPVSPDTRLGKPGTGSKLSKPGPPGSRPGSDGKPLPPGKMSEMADGPGGPGGRPDPMKGGDPDAAMADREKLASERCMAIWPRGDADQARRRSEQSQG